MSFTARPIRKIITNQNIFEKPQGVQNWLSNPKMTKGDKTKRPKLGANPFQPLAPEFRQAFGSRGGKAAQFKSAFASKTGFKLYKLAHPKTELKQEWQDIDGDQINDAIVLDKDGHIISVNGMTIRDSNWKTLNPYYETAAANRLGWDVNHGYRAADGASKVSGISKAWKDKYLKHVYDLVLSKNVGSEEELVFIAEIRKQYPLSKIAKEFIQQLMREEAIKALKEYGFTGSDEEGEAAIKSLTSTKRFKAYIFDLVMKAPQAPAYLEYLANLVRDYILNESKGQYDISQSSAWKANKLEVREGGEDIFSVRIPGRPEVAAVPQGGGGFDAAKLGELLSQLEPAIEDDELVDQEDPNLAAVARSLGMPPRYGQTYRAMYDWAYRQAQVNGVV